ncbi:site-2 protease family protein [Ferdinandcohnia quinoae]|uniref:Site-2 protease family protein n=1 Tax=Fredinandcohnia quinoae TaxID=2918902 RepID=A0AAW5E6D7_9BACI|nr:site-2 protease family protein [Fredinandcohnia sp. SECRCQ15]
MFLFLSVPLTNLLHEVGHVSGAKFLGIKGSQIQLGTGPKLFHFHVKETKVDVMLAYFIGAYSTNEYQGRLQEWKRGVISLSGPILNIIVVVIMTILGLTETTSLRLFILFNLWVGGVNIIPFKIKEKESDGYIFVKALVNLVKGK